MSYNEEYKLRTFLFIVKMGMKLLSPDCSISLCNLCYSMLKITNRFIVGEPLTALITSSYHACIVGKVTAEEAFGSEQG